MSGEVDAVEVLYDADWDGIRSASQIEAMLHALRSAARLEGDGFVVLRYQGERVSIAGRLEDSGFVAQQDDDGSIWMPLSRKPPSNPVPLYRIVGSSDG